MLNAIISCLLTEPAVDFKKAVWGALSRCLPEVSVHGCWFHWAQAVYCRVKEYGLHSAYIHQLHNQDLHPRTDGAAQLASTAYLASIHGVESTLPDQ